MKNRALLLCILNRITSVEEYASKIGVSVDEALDILFERDIMDPETILRNCKIFEVSVKYFLCM